MVLPLPVPPGAGEDAAQFIDLKEYPTLFDDMFTLFYSPGGGAPGGRMRMYAAASPLAVHAVGDFVASYVPSLKDFARLDPRFRLPRSAFAALPQYANWGFAVFQLREVNRETTRVHPMAFSFPVREGGKLFFPTVHIHDGKVHPKEQFDHVLYAQWDGAPTANTLRFLFPPSPWRKSEKEAGSKIDVSKARGIVSGRLPMYRREVRGMLPNQDTWVSPSELT